MAAITDNQFDDLGNGIRLHYASAGERGRPLMLFCHGFPEAWFEWEAQLAHFGDDHFAVAPDLRGFNLSSQPPEVENYRAKLIVEDLRLLIARLGYESAIVVAHDWGGAIAWNLAISTPTLVEKLVIVNSPHPYLFVRDLSSDSLQQRASEYMNWLRAPGSEKALAKDDFRLIDGFFEGRGQGAAHWYTPQLRSRYHAMWSRGLAGGVNYYRASPLHPPKTGEGTGAIQMKPEDWTVRVPVRVIWGEADQALLPRLLDGLDQVCPDLEVHRIPEGSHWVIHEQPERINRLIRSFL